MVAAILALTGLIVVVGGPDDEPARASEPTLLPPAPRVGLCFDSNADGVPVSLVRCDLPHHGEVILAFDLPEGPWPGVADLTEAGKRGCVRRFRQRWGTIEPVHGANIVLLPPTPQLWEKGLRSLHCALVLSDGAKIDHRVGDAPVPHRRLLELKVADCFAEAEGPRDPVNLVDCDRPHRGQAVKLLTLRDGLGGRDGAYPGDAKMRKFIEPKCIPVVQTAANRSTTDIDMEIRFLHPDREQWDDGERTAICLIWAPDKRLRESLVK